MGVNFAGTVGYGRQNNAASNNRITSNSRAQANPSVNNGPEDEGAERNIANDIENA